MAVCNIVSLSSVMSRRRAWKDDTTEKEEVSVERCEEGSKREHETGLLQVRFGGEMVISDVMTMANYPLSYS